MMSDASPRPPPLLGIVSGCPLWNPQNNIIGRFCRGLAWTDEDHDNVKHSSSWFKNFHATAGSGWISKEVSLATVWRASDRSFERDERTRQPRKRVPS